MDASFQVFQPSSNATKRVELIELSPAVGVLDIVDSFQVGWGFLGHQQPFQWTNGQVGSSPTS